MKLLTLLAWLLPLSLMAQTGTGPSVRSNSSSAIDLTLKGTTLLPGGSRITSAGAFTGNGGGITNLAGTVFLGSPTLGQGVLRFWDTLDGAYYDLTTAGTELVWQGGADFLGGSVSSFQGFFSYQGSMEASLMVGTNFLIKSATIKPVVAGLDILLWNSNRVLYAVSATFTNNLTVTTIITNDFVLNTFYTNFSSRSVTVSACFGLTPGGAGNANVGLFIDNDQNGSFERTGITTGHISPNQGITNQLSGTVQSLGRFVWTNLFTGSGVVVIRANSSEWVD